MITWHQLQDNERKVILSNIIQQRGSTKGLSEAIIEKDWWVTMILRALKESSVGQYISFKGGTSLSKAWGVIDRFSEDIDISLHHVFYGIEPTNKSQREKLRKTARTYVTEQLSAELESILHRWGLTDCHIVPITESADRDGMLVPVDSDKDPVVLHAQYYSMVDIVQQYMLPYVKIEISCLNMDEPTEVKHLSSFIHEAYADVDTDAVVDIRTVVPTRTFLEKVFLLAEEFQKAKPRSRRMSRHLYDLWQLMQTPFAEQALANKELYQRIVAHRKAFHHIHYVDYSLLQPDKLRFLPPTQEWMDAYRADYEFMRTDYIYGEAPSFDEIIHTLEDIYRHL